MSDSTLTLKGASKIQPYYQIQLNGKNKINPMGRTQLEFPFQKRKKNNLSPLRAFSVNQGDEDSSKKIPVKEQNYFVQSKELDNSFEIKSTNERDQSLPYPIESDKQKQIRSLLYIGTSSSSRGLSKQKQTTYSYERSMNQIPSFKAIPPILDKISTKKVKSSINLEHNSSKQSDMGNEQYMNYTYQKQMFREPSPVYAAKEQTKSYTFLQDEKNQMLMTQILFRKPKMPNKYYQPKPQKSPQINIFDFSLDKRNKTANGFPNQFSRQKHMKTPNIKIQDDNKSEDTISPTIQNKENLPYVSAESWAIFDAKAGKFFYGSNYNCVRQMASLTKMMTLYVSLKVIKTLDISPFRTYVEVSKKAASMIGTSARLQEGDRLSLYDLMHGMMLPSGNDAATALAENLGVFLFYQSEEYKKLYKENPDQFENGKYKVKNSQSYFINEMNKYAKILELKNTTFANPTGLVNNFNRSTAADLAKLSYHLTLEEKVKKIVENKYYLAYIYMNNNKQRSMIFENTNKLLSHGYSGLKTGITTSAGPCLSAWYQDDKTNLIIILLNSSSMEQRWEDTQNLVNWVLKQQEQLSTHSCQLP